jgi:predicted metal-dependent peptidase
MIQIGDELTLCAADNRYFQSMRLRATQLQPYLASAIFAMIPISSPGRKTFAVDRKWRLYLDMETARAWGIEQSAGVLLHEANHLLRDHHGRGTQEQISHETALTWNVACDIAINDDLVSAGLRLPSPILPATFGFTPGGIEEQYYKRLRQVETMPGVYSCGSGAGGPAQQEAGADDASPALDDVDAFAIQAQVRIAISNASPSTTIPGGLTKWASGSIEARTPWRSLLRNTFATEVHAAIGAKMSTWTRPHRRGDSADIVLRPGHRRVSVQIAVVFDTSQSMNQHLLDVAASELRSLITTLRLSTVTLITCDSESHAPRQLSHVGMIQIRGGGSTDLRVGISAAAELHPRPNIIVVLTDGETPWPHSAPKGTRIIAVVIGDSTLLPAGPGITAVRISQG